MNFKITGFKQALILVLALCTAHAIAAPSPKKTIYGDFIVSSADGFPSVARAYFYGTNQTVIEFENYPLYFSVADESGKKIPFKREGKYARLQGIYKSFVASIDGTAVTFNEIVEEAPAVRKRVALKGYDFNYQVKGDADVLPVQIFDDGDKTYIQFRKEQDMPAVFGVDRDGARLMRLTQEANLPYYSFVGTKQTIQFVLGRSEALAQYAGTRPAPARVALVPVALAQSPAIISPVTPTPHVPPVATVAPPPPVVAAAPVVASTTPTVPAAPVIAPTPTVIPAVVAAPPKPACAWTIESKRAYRGQLQDWIKCAGYKGLDWRGKEMVPDYDADFPGSFLDALLQLKQSTGWDITVFEDNKVIRIVPN